MIPPFRIAILCPGPSLKTGWHANRRKDYDLVIAVNTAAWLFESDWVVGSDIGVFTSQKMRFPKLGMVTHIGTPVPVGLARAALPLGIINELPTPEMRALAEKQGFGQCAWSLPNAIRFAHLWRPGAEVTLYGFDCSAKPDVAGVMGVHDADRWLRELPWVRLCCSMGRVKLDASCAAPLVVRHYIAGAIPEEIMRGHFLPPVLVVPVFSFGKWERLLELWFKRANETTCKLEVMRPDDWIHEGPRVRAGHAWDSKGQAIIHLLRHPRRMFVLDADAFLICDPTEALNKLPYAGPTMRGDDWIRYVQDPCGIVKGDICVQQAGVIWFGEVLRIHLEDEYNDIFDRLRYEMPDEPWLEQMTWSVLWARAGKPVLPMKLNWSYCMKPNPDAMVIHEHGEGKWKRLGIYTQ